MSREVLAPTTLRMGAKRCYRVNMVHDDFKDQQHQKRQSGQPATKTYVEDDMYGEDYNDELDDGNCEIEEVAAGMFKLAMHVPNSFYGGIIGFKGTTKRRIEAETGCEIVIPQKVQLKPAVEGEVIIIKGKSRNAVATTKRKIDLLVCSLRKRIKSTHFYGVALNKGEVRDNFNKLRTQILAAGLPGIDETLFIPDHCIHLTFGVCVLLDHVERQKAIDVLQTCREFLADCKTPIAVKVSGLEIMNDDPSAVNILYASVESPELESLGTKCLQRFIQSTLGLRNAERDTVKLHMTVMNTRYRQKAMPDSTEKYFDAREILKRWGNFNFGSVYCDELVLCVIGSGKESDEFYKVTGSLKL